MVLEEMDSKWSRTLDRLGIFPPLAWGFLGLLLFMIGDGVESGYLSPYLIGLGIPQGRVALVFHGFMVSQRPSLHGFPARSPTCGARAA